MSNIKQIHNLSDLSARLRKEGLPSSRTTILRYETAGVITLIPRHPCGARCYSEEDLNEIVEQVRGHQPEKYKRN